MDPRDRVAALLTSLEHLGVDDLGRLALPPGDRGDRVTARERALAAADEVGLRSLVDDSARDARELVIRAFASNQYQPTWAGLQWGRSLGSAQDRTNLIAAVEDAVLAAAVAEGAEADDVATLAEPFGRLTSMRATYPDLALPGALATRSPLGSFGIVVMFGLVVLFFVTAFGPGPYEVRIAAALVVVVGLVVWGLWRARTV